MTSEELRILVQADDRRILIKDARAYYKGCIPGWEAFANTHGFIWKDVIRHGLLASELLATDDIMAVNLVKYVYGSN